MVTDSEEKTNTHQPEASLPNKELQNVSTKVMINNPKQNEKDIVGNHESSIVTADYIQQSMQRKVHFDFLNSLN